MARTIARSRYRFLETKQWNPLPISISIVFPIFALARKADVETQVARITEEVMRDTITVKQLNLKNDSVDGSGAQ